MIANHQISTILDEINAMRGTILMLENRILRKEIVIAEICDLDVEHGSTNVSQQDGTAPQATRQGLTIIQMVEQVLPNLNGDNFLVRDVKKLCITKFPEDQDKIRRGIYNACSELAKRNVIEEATYGYKIRHKS